MSDAEAQPSVEPNGFGIWGKFAFVLCVVEALDTLSVEASNPLRLWKIAAQY